LLQDFFAIFWKRFRSQEDPDSSKLIESQKPGHLAEKSEFYTDFAPENEGGQPGKMDLGQRGRPSPSEHRLKETVGGSNLSGER
jgi:hypothetical protein